MVKPKILSKSIKPMKERLQKKRPRLLKNQKTMEFGRYLYFEGILRLVKFNYLDKLNNHKSFVTIISELLLKYGHLLGKR